MTALVLEERSILCCVCHGDRGEDDGGSVGLQLTINSAEVDFLQNPDTKRHSAGGV